MTYRIIMRDGPDHEIVATLDDVTIGFAESVFEISLSNAKAGDWLRLESNFDGGVTWRKVRSETVT